MATIQHITLDATDKKLGRLATQAAKVLMGKHTPAYRPNMLPATRLTIENVGKMDIGERRLANLVYKRYSGHPGGLKVETGTLLKARKGNKALLEIAIYGMLPKNKLRDPRMKLLTIHE